MPRDVKDRQTSSDHEGKGSGDNPAQLVSTLPGKGGRRVPWAPLLHQGDQESDRGKGQLCVRRCEAPSAVRGRLNCPGPPDLQPGKPRPGVQPVLAGPLQPHPGSPLESTWTGDVCRVCDST